MEVCHFINGIGNAGAENLLAQFVETADHDDISHTVLYLGTYHDLAPRFESSAADLVCLDARTDPPQLDPALPIRFLRAVRSRQFDVVHTHNPYTHLLARTVGRAVGEFEVCSTRHIVEDSLNPVISIGDELTRHRESASVAVSCGVQRSYTDRTNRYRETGLDGGWCTIHNGIDVAEYADRVDAAEPALQNAGTPAFLNVGRYVPQKRQRDLIDAVAILTESVPDATLHIVGGSGPLKSDLRTRAKEQSVADAVTVTGFVPDVAAYYTAADAFVSSSVSEGLPVTILEAMSSGLPVVGTDIPGVDEVVEQEESGYLVSPEDPSALAGAMERLADDETRRRLGENGHERARKRFDVRQMVDAYHDLYLDLAGDRR